MKYLILICLTNFFIACSSITSNDGFENVQHNISNSQNDTNTSEINMNNLELVGDSVMIPPFEIEVVLSEKAEKKLKKDNETVVVMARFTGKPVGNIPVKYKDRIELGELFLFAHRIELKDKRLAKFDNIRFSKELYDILSDKNINLLINVYSGRRSIDENLLDCEILQNVISEVKDKKFILRGKLIKGE